MANGIVGSMLILAVASLIGVPLGIGAGVYLAEYGRNRLGDAIRFTCRRAEWRALDCDWHRGLVDPGAARKGTSLRWLAEWP